MSVENERYIVDVDNAPTLAVDLGRLAALAFAHRAICASAIASGRHTVSIREQLTGELRASWAGTALGWRLTCSVPEWLS